MISWPSDCYLNIKGSTPNRQDMIQSAQRNSQNTSLWLLNMTLFYQISELVK